MLRGAGRGERDRQIDTKRGGQSERQMDRQNDQLRGGGGGGEGHDEK